jgi:hypothetical protein
MALIVAGRASGRIGNGADQLREGRSAESRITFVFSERPAASVT